MSKLLAALVVAALALVVLAAASGPAGATYRGKANGRLAFGINVNGNTDVYSVEPDGSDLQRLTTDPGFDACAAYSADGKRIAYCSGAGGGPVQVWTMNQDGTDKQQVTHLGFTAIFPDFSRDGKQIVFCAGPTALGRDIYVVNSDGTGLEQLTSGEGNNVYPAFSPHGHKIVFTSNRTGTSQVWVMNADGSHQTQLTFDSLPKDQVPDWSPDGHRIAYLADTHGISDVTQSWGDIWVMDANGSHQHAITHGASYYGTAWSPDGTRIATMDLPTRTIYTLKADGTDPQALHPLGLQFVPGWQPLGHQGPHTSPATPPRIAFRSASAPATPRAGLVTTTVTVKMFNSSYHLNPKTAPRGVVIFKVVNKAVFQHDFSINGHTTPALKTGQSATLRVTFPKPGHYVYKDSIDHHTEWGDIGGFIVT